jgi:phage protein D
MTFFDYDPLKRDTLIDTDPFQGSKSQTNRMRAYCDVWIDGINITNRIEPHLISVRIVDGTKKTCELEIDDRDALLPIPPLIAAVEVLLGWKRESMFKMFKGTIKDFEHGFGRKQGGRRMWVHAEGTNVLTTRLKEPMNDNMGEGAPPGQKEGKKIPVTTWIQKVAKNGGASADVNNYFAKFTRDHWQMMGESPLHKIESLGEELGAEVQWGEGNKLFFEVPGQRGKSCEAVWGDNLIGWRVFPFSAHSAHKGAKHSVFDNIKGQWNQIEKSFDNAGTPAANAAATGGPPSPANTESAANQANEGASTGADSAFAGVGRIVINGEPAAQWNSFVLLKGARPGVDGMYRIVVAEHIYSRQGYVTWLDVYPHRKASGSDNIYKAWPLPRPALNVG